MKIEFCNLKRQYKFLKQHIDDNINKVLQHAKFINGPEIKILEQKCQYFTNTKNAIGVSSGTDALLIALIALNIKKGDYVITTPFTFIATAEVITLLGATPIFVDIDPQTYNIDPNKVKQFLQNPTDQLTKQLIQKNKIKAIIAVDLFGQCADYDKIKEIAKEYDLFVIQDAAQSFGADFGGKKSCSSGDISTTSFFPAKPLGCYGDAGMIFTNNYEFAENIRRIINHGQITKYNHTMIGTNARLDTIQASILLAKLETFTNQEIDKRNKAADYYNTKLKQLSDKESGKDIIILPYIKENNKSVWAQYSIQVKDRDNLVSYLKQKQIPTSIHYPKPLHLQKAFEYLGYQQGDFPIAEQISTKILSLPIDAYITEEELDYITNAIIEFYEQHNKIINP